MKCTRWRRYGKDRLYVSDDSGRQIGWWDLTTDDAHPEQAGDLQQLTNAVLEWKQTQESPVAVASPEPEEVPETSEPVNLAPGPIESVVSTAILPKAAPAPPTQERRNTHVDLAVTVPAPPPDPFKSSPAPPSEIPVDLLANSAGHQLAEQIAAAHAAGQRPTLLRRFFLGKNAYSTWERGAIGERLVAKELEKLVRKDPRWGFIHSIPVGSNGADIDHLVIGPGGVFTLNTKYHKNANIWVGGNTFMVNGARQPYIRNSRSEAKRASRLLAQASGIEVDANGLVVPVAAGGFTVKAQPDDIRVVNRGRLVQYFRQVPDLLSKDTITTLFEFARLSSTWSPVP